MEEAGMRVIVVGATGTIGTAVVAALAGRHEVISVSHSKGERRVDMASPTSIERLFNTIGPFDAVISTAGRAAFKPLMDLTNEDFQLSLSNKLMGQVNLVRIGARFINEGGSFTLTSGVLASEPMPGSAAVSLVNAGIEGFGRAAALEKPRNIRVNVVSPPWVSETLAAMGRDPAGGMPAAQVARAYVHGLEGSGTGEVIDARKFA
ncbi:short chain dehydrogenase [Microvirga sp. WGZ8]|uniref:Short chain dehydrogenase n=2 Tax=Microvirga puerhi TaxID=2876078 RepID=A0ABS7VLM5_9HYPH|nr:short chain dehydrogenase [Microvirga puerhi]MBZ6075975.1 short chain dehydrogenase [Microvirga puerhi]